MHFYCLKGNDTMRYTLLLALTFLGAHWVSPAQAEETPAWTVSKNIVYVSDDYARGISQS
jgi:hypothetical protein